MEWLGVDTYFSVYQRPFPHNIKFKLETLDFLISCNDFLILLGTSEFAIKQENIHFLGKLGTIFLYPRTHMRKNIEKICDKYNEDYEKYKYIENIILWEKSKYKLEVTEAILSLRRELQFFLEFFEGVCNDETLVECISTFAKASYVRNLERYQNCCCCIIYNCMISLLPRRKTFLKKLAFNSERNEDFVLYDMNDFTINLRHCLRHLSKFYIANGLEWEYKL
ncbi:hypothetical protein FQR65_LT09840 [Abscondita terminalis]|nr:hypothetical protein FQR65_LT09840 [Abscondita terminalis]